MKNLIYKTIFLFSFLFVLGACEEDVMVELNPDANTVVSLSPSTVVLLEDNAAANATTVSWTEPDFGFEAAATYTIMIDFHGGNFSAPQTFVAGSDLSKTLTVQELNGKLLTLGVDPEEPTQIDIKVETKLSNYKKMYSAPITMTVTAYSTILDLSTAWGVVGSATPGGWGSTPTTPIKDIPFWTTSTAGVYVAYGTVRTGEIKFRSNNSWTTNYGDNGVDGTLDAGGANIQITAGTYKFTFNSNNLTYTIVPFTYGIVGSGVSNGWGAPDTKLYYNSYNDDWRAIVTFLDGEIKFRFNEMWNLPQPDGSTVNWGGSNGTLALGGANIPVTAGHYLVIFNPTSLEYSIEPVTAWGLVGSATVNGWNGPNDKFIPDFGINEGTYYLNGVTLTAGEIKIRQNDGWVVSYGYNGTMSGDLYELNSNNAPNIPVTAGTYNLVLNFAATPPTLGIFPFQ
jgi:hypothetical protein